MLFTANSTLQVASANVDATETVSGLHINQMWFGSDGNGFWTVKRGANTIQIAETTVYNDYAGCGAALQLDASANVVVNCTSANCTLIIDFQKVSTFTSEY